jgi:hypothetical protein
MTAPREVTPEDRLRRIDALDLEPIVYKLTQPEPGETPPIWFDAPCISDAVRRSCL